ncbi:hypothetical protein JCM10212_005179 [Sporobolomyces blumeae]
MAQSSEWVTLVSDQGFRFILPRSAALGAEMVKDSLEGDFREASSNVVSLGERAEVLEKVVEYLMYKDKYTNSKDNVPDFKDRVKPEIALELLMASDYMGC